MSGGDITGTFPEAPPPVTGTHPVLAWLREVAESLRAEGRQSIVKAQLTVDFG